jgi:hypothetical protein
MALAHNCPVQQTRPEYRRRGFRDGLEGGLGSECPALAYSDPASPRRGVVWPKIGVVDDNPVVDPVLAQDIR